ncbi:MAG: histidine phosphatase family protein [Eubacterium sp.]
MKEIYLIRHGRQSSKLCNVDVSLDDAGRKQAHLVASRLISYGLEALYASRLLRAQETAQAISEATGLPIKSVGSFQEIEFGELTGLSNEKIEEQYGDFVRQRASQESDLAYPGGENGQDVIDRIWRDFKSICEAPEKKVAIVTHGGVIRALCAFLLHMPMKHKLQIAIDLENTSITQILYDENTGRFYLERLNDYEHLMAAPELLRKYWKTSLISEQSVDGK